MILHPDRYNPTSTTRKHGVVVHDSESGDGTAAILVGLLATAGDRWSDPADHSKGRYGAGYHAVTDGNGGYTRIADQTAGPFSAPPCNATWAHVCMPGRAAQSRGEWLDELSAQHIRGVARFILDQWALDGYSWPLEYRNAAQLVAGLHGYTSHAQVALAWHKTTHTDPGVWFPWDVLQSRIEAATTTETVRTDIAPQQENDMTTARLVRNPNYRNVWLVGVGPALHMSPELAASYENDGIPTILSDHAQLLKAMLYQSGLTAYDLVGV